MSDLEKYIRKREKRNPNFRKEVDEERRNLRIGLRIKELRLEKGTTQDQLALLEKRFTSNFHSCISDPCQSSASVRPR